MDRITLDFLEFEKKKALFEREYCGFHYWQGMRLKIGEGIEGIREMALEKRIVPEGRKKIVTHCKDFLKDVWNYLFLKKCDILYFDQGLDGAYRNVDGEMRDVYFGYFGYEEIYRVQRCYYIDGSKRNPQKPGVGVSLILPYKLLARIQNFLNRERYIDQKEEEFICDLCNEMNVKYQKNILSDLMIQEIQYNRELYQIYEKYYNFLLKRTHPKVIILQCHYSITLHSLYKVAKKLSIPVIELQHGLVNNHLAYYYLDTTDSGKDLPDYFFTYGRFWEEQMRLPAGMQTITVGNPFLEVMKEKYKNEVPDEKAIVFYTGSYSYDGKELEKLAVRFCQKYADEGYKIYFKFHPGETAVWKENYKLLCNCKGISIVEPGTNVYCLFAMARHHVCVYSTVIYETLIYNVRRYIYNMEGIVEAAAAISLPLLEIGAAQKFCNAQELKELITAEADTGFGLLDEIWRLGAKEKGQKALKEIMEKSARF